MARTLIGQILIEQGVINEKQLAAALSHQRGLKQKLGEVLVELGFALEEDVAKALATQQRMPYVDLNKGGRISREILDKIPLNVVEQYGILPLMMKGGKPDAPTEGAKVVDGDSETALSETERLLKSNGVIT